MTYESCNYQPPSCKTRFLFFWLKLILVVVWLGIVFLGVFNNQEWALWLLGIPIFLPFFLLAICTLIMPILDFAIEWQNEINGGNGMIQESRDRIDALQKKTEDQKKELESLKALTLSVEQADWPGMWKKHGEDDYWRIMLDGAIDQDSIDFDYEPIIARMTNNYCKTQHEAEFIKRHLTARLQIIDRLTELNGGNSWIDWKDGFQLRYIPIINHKLGKIEVQLSLSVQTAENYFYARTESIWQQVINELGKETIKIGLWPEYKGE